MSFPQIYVSMNLLLLLACAIAVSTRTILALTGRRLSFQQQLYCAYGLVAAALVMSVAAPFMVHSSFLPATAQIWSAPTANRRSMPAAPAVSPTIAVRATGTELPLDLLTAINLACCLGGLTVAATRMVISVTTTRRIIAAAHPLRRAGALRLLATDEARVPFSFWQPGSFYIVVPVALLARAADLRIAIHHEAQHHRQGDTRVLYAVQLLKGALLFNPAVHILCRHIQELQELACDAAVVSREGINGPSYCACLLRIAEAVRAARDLPACMQMAAGARTLLARRIDALLGCPGRRLRQATAAVAMVALISPVVVTALGLPGTIQDRRISTAQAEEMAARARAHSSFPIVMNAQVLEQLNQLLGTPAGRAFTRASLQRMRRQGTATTHLLEQLRLPVELIAVPLVESGYRNLPPDANPVHGAGLWQLTAPAARSSGLTLEGGRDERMDPVLESQAAARLLSGLYAQFGDWNLALLAYNSGTAFVDRSIREAGTRDAFRLTQLRSGHDQNYVARVMAAIIVIRNMRTVPSD